MAGASTSTHSRARVNGIELAYQIHGRGKPLVLLHGAFGSAEMFGPTLGALAGGRQVIGVDLQSHGRTPAVDRPMRFETMADDIAALIRHLGHEQADVMGFSLGGGVALRTAIQHADTVRRLVVVSSSFKRNGWHPEMVAGFDRMGPEMAEPMKQTPMYEVYRKVAPRPQDWPILVSQITTLMKLDYDWTEEARALPMPVLIVAGDADGLPPRHAVEFFELLGGGKRDAVWDRSGMTRHGLAVLPRVTHYDIDVAPALATTVASFLDAPD
jgi:pimeloyl-ACP methyl ester carboxylesterase